jgi:acyl-CoA thioesterase-1
MLEFAVMSSQPVRALVLCLGLLLAGSAFGQTEERVILVIGDSLSAGYGIGLDEGWVQLLQRRLEQQGYRYRVVNASVSGDTTAGGAARLPRALRTHRPAIIIIELGGNDGLRGQPVPEIRRNLAKMIEAAQQADARILLLGIRLPPNYGPDYTADFHAVYTALAQRYHVPLVPFLLEGVAGQDKLMQADGIHPRAGAQPRILDNVWPRLVPLLHKARATR